MQHKRGPKWAVVTSFPRSSKFGRRETLPMPAATARDYASRQRSKYVVQMGLKLGRDVVIDFKAVAS